MAQSPHSDLAATNEVGALALTSPPERSRWLPLATGFFLLWFAGFNLRSVLLGVPPVLSQVEHTFHLSPTTAGILSALPVLALGACALPGAWLASRKGASGAVGIGLWLTALGAVVRALPGGIISLFVGTALFAIGSGLAQPALASVTRERFPHAIQRASSILSLGMICGETVAAAITAPWMTTLLHGWRGTFVAWGVCAAIGAIIWTPATIASHRTAGVPPARLRPLLSQPLLWWLTALFAGQSLVYFTATTWLPQSAVGGSSSAAVSLALINGISLPMTVLLALTRWSFVRSRAFYVVGSLSMVLGTIGWVIAPNVGLQWCAAGIAGLGIASTFTGLIAYPAAVAAPGDVATLAALIWTTSYIAAFFGPIIGGIAITLSHNTKAAFIPVIATSILMLVASLLIPHSAHMEASDGSAPKSAVVVSSTS